mgnify:FL=1
MGAMFWFMIIGVCTVATGFMKAIARLEGER